MSAHAMLDAPGRVRRVASVAKARGPAFISAGATALACACACACALSAAQALAAQPAITEHTLPGSTGQPGTRGASGSNGGKAQVITLAPGQATLKVLQLRDHVPSLSTTPSLTALEHTREVGYKRTKLLVAAGMSADRADRPAGLLVSGGVLRSAVDASPGSLNMRNRCGEQPRTRYRWPSLLCVPNNPAKGSWTLLPLAEYQPGQCREALQTGQFLVEAPATPNPCLNGDATASVKTRLAACIDDKGRLHTVMASQATSAGLAQWLATGPLKCSVAALLTSEATAGWLQPPSAGQPLSSHRGGAVDVALPSALMITLN